MKIKYLIAGYGNIGHKRQVALAKKCVATFDPNINKSPTYTKLEKIDYDKFDAAVLCVPQNVKLELTRHFLNKGKHVLVEKPLIISEKDGRLLDNLARKNSVIWHTSYNHRYEPNIIKLNSLLRLGKIGKLYHGRLVYSFGNIRERLGTWREEEFSVLEEIAPHLLDIVINISDVNSSNFETLISRKIEANIFDHWIFSTEDKAIIIENSAVTWKNVFSIDIYGELGSVHVFGLNKWGGSQLTLRKRIFPSGTPNEKVISSKGRDMTWVKDFQAFEIAIEQKRNSLEHDLKISRALAQIALSATGLLNLKEKRKYKQIIQKR